MWVCTVAMPHGLCPCACAHVEKGGHVVGWEEEVSLPGTDHAESEDPFLSALESILGSIWLLGLASSGDVITDGFSLSWLGIFKNFKQLLCRRNIEKAIHLSIHPSIHPSSIYPLIIHLSMLYPSIHPSTIHPFPIHPSSILPPSIHYPSTTHPFIHSVLTEPQIMLGQALPAGCWGHR